MPARVQPRRRAGRRAIHVGAFDRLQFQIRRPGLRLDHVRRHRRGTYLPLYDQTGEPRFARAGGPHRDARPGQPVVVLHPRPERRLPLAELRAEQRGDGTFLHHGRIGFDAVGLRKRRRLLHVHGGLPLRPRHLPLPQPDALRPLHRPDAALHAACDARQAGQSLPPALVHDQPPPGAFAPGRAGILDQQRPGQLLGQFQPRRQRRFLPALLLPRI